MASQDVDLLILGGGAAGLAAGIQAKKMAPAIQVMILERNEIFGKKLRATGNGRGNLSNVKLPTHGETRNFFHDLGILTRVDEAGRIYPFSESAAQCTAMMVQEAKALGCEMRANTLVEKVAKKGNGFFLQTSRGDFHCQKLILATGGKAGISSADKQKMRHCDGYAFAASLGHTLTKTTPVLTGVQVEDLPKELAGIRVKGGVCLFIAGQDAPVFAEKGEIQFTDYGLSGICVFNLSRYLKYVGDEKLAPYTIEIDLDPDRQGKALIGESQGKGQTVLTLVSGLLKENLAQWICQRAGFSPHQPIERLDEQDRQRLYQEIIALRLQPVGTMGFQMAQCTAGGVKLEELDPENGASKIQPGLYIVGELMDYDGPCGGYNLDHAFQTGMLAARDAVRALQSEGSK